MPTSLPTSDAAAAAVFLWSDALIRITIIILITLGLLRIVHLLARRVQRRLAASEVDQQQVLRIRTLLQTARSGIDAVIILLAVFMILYALGINVVPLLAGASVAGLAVSLGAQTLIKDYIAGALILLDDLYRVGDSVEIGGVSGRVEHVTLRTTHLRKDGSDVMCVVPNGEVRVVINQRARPRPSAAQEPMGKP